MVASTESGDTIEVQDDGSVIINNSDGTSTTLPSDRTSVVDTSGNSTATISKADTSGMDFSFDDEDTQTETETTGDVSDNTTTSSSGTDLYNITSGGTYTFSGTITDTMITVDAGNADVTNYSQRCND